MGLRGAWYLQGLGLTWDSVAVRTYTQSWKIGNHGKTSNIKCIYSTWNNCNVNDIPPWSSLQFALRKAWAVVLQKNSKLPRVHSSISEFSIKNNNKKDFLKDFTQKLHLDIGRCPIFYCDDSFFSLHLMCITPPHFLKVLRKFSIIVHYLGPLFSFFRYLLLTFHNISIWSLALVQFIFHKMLLRL